MKESFDDLWIWRESELSGRLLWYRCVASNRAPAKFRICNRIPVALDLEHATEEALVRELDAKTQEFLALWQCIRSGEALPAGPRPNPSLLDLCRELAKRWLRHCNFCRWDCQVDRLAATHFGACKLGAETRVSTYFHHGGEELIYRGRLGSGTIFFTSCNMRCAFCQNGDISTDRLNGQAVTARTLAAMAWLLRMEGCHNVNWVGGEATIHLHTIIEAISLLEDFEPEASGLRAALPVKADHYFRFPARTENSVYAGKFNAPMLWNSNFFMSELAMKILRLTMDVWLPDFKFGPGRCAVELAKTPWYWETVTANLKALHAWGEDVTIRHLIMPEHVECCTRPVLEWIAENVPDVPVNVMDQYHPNNFCEPGSAKFRDKYQPIARPCTPREIRLAYRYAKDLGVLFEALSYEKNSTGVTL
jgi:putative pyruvate formate lyase activating enzyme